MRKLPDFSAVIFDMDGLVLDTETTYCLAWQQAATELGYDFSTGFCLSMSGLHSKDVEKKLFAHCGNDFNLVEFQQVSGRCWNAYVKQYGIRVKKGFFTLINLLEGQDIAFSLATNSLRKNALECLKLAGIDTVFPIVIARDDVKQGKPAPDIFLHAAERLNTPISECLVIEDSNTGIQAAINAKAPSVFIPSILPFDAVTAEQASFFVNDLDELAQIILSEYRHPV